MEGVYATAIRRGIREAYQAGNKDNVADLWIGVEGFEFDPSAVFIETQEDYDKLEPGQTYYRIGHWGKPYGRKPPEEEEGEME